MLIVDKKDALDIVSGTLPVVRGGTGVTTSTGTGNNVLSTSPTLVTPNIGTATGTSFNSITGLATVAPLVAGTAAIGTGTTVARADHVHPVQTTITGNAASSTRISFSDRRNVVQTPSHFGAGADFSFMANATDGLSDGGSYHGVMHFQPYNDATGGGAYEVGFTDSNNMWLRGSSGALSTWGPWKKLWDSSNLTNLNQLVNGPGYATGGGTASGTNTGDQTTITGNAGTATTLQTARTINGVAFNGSDNITVSDNTKLTKTNPSIIGSVTEQVYDLTGIEINPANGTIQYKTVSSDTTFTETLTTGQSVLLRLINASSYIITFPTITWVGAAAPVLTANCVIVLWKEQTTLYGAYVGSLV